MTTQSSKRLTPPLKWHGGKNYLAGWIIDHFPPHLHYVEPFFGGGAVLFRRDHARDWIATGEEKLPARDCGASEVVNDVDGELVNFWRVLADEVLFPRFLRKVQATPLSQELFVNSPETEGDSVEQAVAFFIRYRQSRQGLGRDFATLSRTRTRRRMNEQASAWLTAVEGLPDAHDRLSRVVILNDDGFKVIGREDGPKTLFYCDPPYLHETRTATNAYTHEMSRSDHERLLKTLAGIQGSFLLSGYHSTLYDEFAHDHGWVCYERQIDNKSSSRAKKEIKTECLWANYELAGDA